MSGFLRNQCPLSSEYAIGGNEYQIALDGLYGGSGPVGWELSFSTLRLTSPPAASVFAAPGPITLSAEATDYDGAIARVEFLQNGVLLGTVSNAPFTMTWSNVLSADYSLQARAVDAAGVVRDAPPVAISVLPANDGFANRIWIPGSNAVLHARSRKATLEAGEPTHGPVSWESLWWTWTAPGSGRATLSKPSAIDFRYVLLNVYTGLTLPELLLITNTPGTGSGTLTSSIAWDVHAGDS